jgi:hypothetical protein
LAPTVLGEVDFGSSICYTCIWTRDAPDTVLQDIQPAGYPANLKAGYWISGRISCWISGSTHKLIVKYNTPAIFKARLMNVFFYKIKKGEIFVDRKPIAMFCSKFNKLSWSRLIDWLFKVSCIRPDIWPSNPVSGRITDLKKGRIIWPDIGPTGLSDRISGQPDIQCIPNLDC